MLSHGEEFRVELHLSSVVKDVAFAQFIASEQQELPEEGRLSVFEVLALNQIREGKRDGIDSTVIDSLFRRGMIEKRGRTKGYTTSYLKATMSLRERKESIPDM